MTKSELWEKTGGFLLDIAKLVIAGVVLSTIFDDGMSKVATLLLGISSIVLLLIAGYFCFSKSLK